MAVTMAQGMKRLGTPIAALLGLVLIGLIAISWLINRDALRNAVEAQIRAVTGLDLTVGGAIDVSVFPGSYVSFHDVGLKGGGSGDPALHVDVLTANLRLLPLLMQRFEIITGEAPAPCANGDVVIVHSPRTKPSVLSYDRDIQFLRSHEMIRVCLPRTARKQPTASARSSHGWPTRRCPACEHRPAPSNSSIRASPM